MARNYANVSTAIWRDEDFRKLTAAAQRMYLLALSQSDISAAGVLALRLPRWAATAVDTSPADIQACIDELQSTRHVVYDEIAGELLVRSFVRWDGGYGNRKRLPVILKAAREIESPAIRCALAVEFERLGIKADGLCDGHPDGHADGLCGDDRRGIPGASSDRVAETPPGTLSTNDQLPVDNPKSQVNRLSDTASDGITPSEGVVVTKALVVGTATHNPQPTTRSASGGPPAPHAAPPDSASTIVSAYIDAYKAINSEPPTKGIRGRVGRQAKELIAQGIPTERLIAAAKDMAVAGWHDLEVQLQRSAANARTPTSGVNRHIDPLTPEQRRARNPFLNAVRASDTIRPSDPGAVA